MIETDHEEGREGRREEGREGGRGEGGREREID